jgi:hypothetical protein
MSLYTDVHYRQFPHHEILISWWHPKLDTELRDCHSTAPFPSKTFIRYTQRYQAQALLASSDGASKSSSAFISDRGCAVLHFTINTTLPAPSVV